MKSSKRNVLLAALTAAVMTAAWAMPAWAGPKLVMASLNLNLGKVREGQLAKGVFEVANQGDAELIIKKVSPG